MININIFSSLLIIESDLEMAFSISASIFSIGVKVAVTILDDILDVFSPYQMYVEQVDLDRYRKVYYTVENLATQGVVAKIEDADGVLHFMASPLLLPEEFYENNSKNEHGF